MSITEERQDAKNAMGVKYVSITDERKYVKNARGVKFANIIKMLCKQCGGSQICEHNKMKTFCK